MSVVPASTASGFGAIRGVDRDTAPVREQSLEEDYEQQVAVLRKTFESGKTRNVNWRLQQLRILKQAWIKNKDKVTEALSADLGRPAQMSHIYEYINVLAEINLMIKKTRKWAKRKKAHTGYGAFPASSYVQYEPKGVILCVGPWNFPFVLTVIPLVNMISAGNCVVMKPSEISENSAKLLTSILGELDSSAFRTINGAVPETTALLSRQWDHIMYTGNGMVGRIVMKAAAENLTPVTLELGGKCPTYIDKTANLKLAASRLAFSKVACTGQICIAPDYTIIHQEVRERFTKLFVDELKRLYGEKLDSWDEAGKIVNQRHWDRVASLAKSDHGGEVIFGGLEHADRDTKYFPTTVIDSPDLESRIMQEEIFGPLMPLVTVKSAAEAIKMIKAKERPLAVYVFAGDNRVVEKFLNNTSSGAFVQNDCVYHAISSTLPFGGIGPSGIGAYKGWDGFLEFSHKKAIMKRGTTEYSMLRPWKANEQTLEKVTALLLKLGLWS